MKTSKFSRQELFDLRNHIQINLVITDILVIPSKWRDGYLRFLCPACGEFQTATNPKSNLARCFRCRKNFNPIDLAMTDKNDSGCRPRPEFCFSYPRGLWKHEIRCSLQTSDPKTAGFCDLP